MATGRTGRFSVGEPPDLPRARHVEIARAGDLGDRCVLAGSRHVDRSVLRILCGDPDPRVASSLAFNSWAPTDILEELLESRPEVREVMALNWNAPADLKDEVPLGTHSSASVERYLDQRDASPEARGRLLRMYAAAGHPGDPALTLGVAWAAAST